MLKRQYSARQGGGAFMNRTIPLPLTGGRPQPLTRLRDCLIAVESMSLPPLPSGNGAMMLATMLERAWADENSGQRPHARPFGAHDGVICASVGRPG